MGFNGAEQGEGSIIFLSLYKKYWEIGFKTRLYDCLSPEAYLGSLQRTGDFLELKEGECILDAGCGTGLLLPCLQDQLRCGGRYLGMDVLPAGLDSLKSKAQRLDLMNSVLRIQGDLSMGLPLNDASVSCVAAHFSVYTLPEVKKRKEVYQEFWRILKPGGRLITANPVHTYDARQIVCSSLELLRKRGEPWIFKKYIQYPVTLHLGLKHIERQLKAGRWHGYRPGELQNEVAQAGFSIEHSETVYGGSGCLVVGRKP